MMANSRSVWIALLAVSCWLSWSLPAKAEPAALELQPCHIDGVARWVQCGALSVPLDPSAQASERLTLRVVVVPAVQQPAKADPLFALAGGPGQSAVAIAGQFDQFLRSVNRDRDIILVDQRGTGESSPFACDRPIADVGLEIDDLGTVIAECLASVNQDPTRFTTGDFIADLEQVRQALGAATINLYGGSYGTRAALAYMRAHPEVIRSAILDGVAPFGMRIGTAFGADGEASLRGLIERCATQAACAAEFGDIRSTLAALTRRLQAAPERILFLHPATGIEQTEVITADLFNLSLRALLYIPQTQRLIPLVIAQAGAGNWRPFIGLSMASSEGLLEVINPMLMYAVLCAEDLRDFAASDIAAAERDSFVGGAQADIFVAACERWPLPEAAFDTVMPVNTTPTLLLSGALDPVTPPRWAELAQQSLPNSRHIVVADGAHIVARYGCLNQHFGAFLDSLDTDFDVDCAAATTFPSFFVNTLGPAPQAVGEAP